MGDTGEIALRLPESLCSLFQLFGLISSPIQQPASDFLTFSKAASVELKLNLSTGWKQDYFSPV